MSAILMIDGLGKRYGLLPSEVLNRSNTFDLYIMDAAMAFEHYHNTKASTGKAPIPQYNTDELVEMFNKGKQA